MGDNGGDGTLSTKISAVLIAMKADPKVSAVRDSGGKTIAIIIGGRGRYTKWGDAGGKYFVYYQSNVRLTLKPTH